MIETHGPAFDAELTYRREQVREAVAARRAAYARRAARARTRTEPTGRRLTTVLRGWLLSRSGAWHAAR